MIGNLYRAYLVVDLCDFATLTQFLYALANGIYGGALRCSIILKIGTMYTCWYISRSLTCGVGVPSMQMVCYISSSQVQLSDRTGMSEKVIIKVGFAVLVC
jgi:hypothetical protein